MENQTEKTQAGPLASGALFGELTVSLAWTGQAFMWLATSADGKFAAQGRTADELQSRCGKTLIGHQHIVTHLSSSNTTMSNAGANNYNPSTAKITMENQPTQSGGTVPAVVSDALFCGHCRSEAVLIVTFGTIEDLIDKGMLTGPKVLTEDGRKIVADLRASGFNPTPEETEWAMRAITSLNNPGQTPEGRSPGGCL